MSDQEPLPPLSPQVPQVIAPTSPPVLPYAQAGGQRPGILTAAGILSIVFGGFGTLANLCGTFQSTGLLLMPTLAWATAAVTSTAPADPFEEMPVTPFAINAILNVACLGLAVYLVVCGAMVLRGQSSGRKHHLRYATWKFILALPAALAEAWSFYSLYVEIPSRTSAVAGSAESAAFVGLAVGMAGFWLVASLAYPIALVIIMRLKQVRSYYAKLEEVAVIDRFPAHK